MSSMPAPTTVAEVRLARLEKLVRELGTLDAVAAKVGTSAIYLSQLRGRAPDQKTGRPRSMGSMLARRIEIACGKQPGWMDTRPREDIAPKDFQQVVAAATGADAVDGYIRLPLLSDAGAGPGRLSDDEVVLHLDVLEAWLRQRWPTVNPTHIRLVTARGNSLTGKIEDGDLMFIEPITEWRGDGVYVLSVEDSLLVKLLNLRVMDGMLSIESTNGMAPELATLADVGERVLIHGKVLGAWSLRMF